jgi:ABC-type glycerol-3-phosphate transport system permease component
VFSSSRFLSLGDRLRCLSQRQISLRAEEQSTPAGSRTRSSVAGSVVLLSLAVSSSSEFAFGRIDFKGRRTLLLTILGVSMFPQIAVLSGLFELIRALHLYNTRAGLILSDIILTLPFTIWTLTTFMRTLPKELEEAAVIDGAGPWTVLLRVFLPLLAPALATTGLLAFIAAWNRAGDDRGGRRRGTHPGRDRAPAEDEVPQGKKAGR